MPKNIETSSQVHEHARSEHAGMGGSGFKYLTLACSLSALLSACVGVVDGSDDGAGGVSGVATAGSSSIGGSSGNAAGSVGTVSGSGNASAGTSSGFAGSSFGGSSFGGSSFGGSSFGGSNSAGNGAGGRAGAGGRNGANGGSSNGGASSGGTNGGGTSSGGASTGSAGSTAVVCTSKTTWTSGNGANMRPGNACRSCHSNFTVAGTIYPTAHEPINCNGINGLTTGVKVMIKGANGTTVTLTPGSTGNFYSTANITKPYTVTLTGNGTMRSMLTPQTSGDCNSCHTQNGAMGAPGRIMSP